MRVTATILLCLLLLPALTLAQTSPTASVTGSLPRLQQLIENTRVDLARLRVDKWKTDSGNKEQAQANITSLQRNMSSALPEIITAVQANPGSLGESFKLYRNLNVLYDVLMTVAESAGAFGPKDEYAPLASDVQNLDMVRHSIADQIESLASSKDAQIARMEAQARQASTAAAAAPAKKIVVDDNAPTPKKKPAAKKKPAPQPPQ